MRILKAAPVLLVLFLTACGSKTVSYNLTANVANETELQNVLAMTTRMVERRVESIEAQEGIKDTVEDITINRNSDGNGATLKLAFSTPIIAPILTEDLLEPFTLEFMEETPSVEDADFVVADTQGYKRIPLGKDDISWLLTEEATGTPGVVTMQFTPEGAEKKKELFAQRMGQNIGIFIRGLPIYRLRVEQNDVDEPFLLIKVPNAELGGVFADDVNTGLHVAFTQ